MALYKSFDIEFFKEVLIMALLEEIIEFLVFSSYYIHFLKSCMLKKNWRGQKDTPKIHYEIQIPHPKNLPMKSLTLI